MPAMWRGIDIADHTAEMAFSGFRMVEDQQKQATCQLVDTQEEHALLEALIDGSKPPLPDMEGTACAGDYLLFTPFRYKPPLRGATRFGRRDQGAPFYGADGLSAAMAEMVYKINSFDSDTDMDIPNRSIAYTSFQFDVRSPCALDILTPAFAAHYDDVHHESSYEASHELGAAMRDCGVQFCVFASVRCKGARNVAVFDPAAFVRKSYGHKDWACSIWRDEISFRQKRGEVITFQRYR